MPQSNQGIRKAAILVASLEPPAADALLDRMEPERARQVRQAMVALGEIDPQEQRRVIDEFYRVGPIDAAGATAGLSSSGTAIAKTGRRTSARSVDPSLPKSNPAAEGRPFRFLQEAEVDKLARVLSGERLQTIALVLSHLPPRQAAGVLARLKRDQQVEVIRRLVELEETDPEILREVEEALQARLSQQVCMQRRRVAGLTAVNAILEAADSRLSAEILDHLASFDQPLAQRLSPPAPRFEDLVRWDDAAMWSVFEAAPPEVVMTALVGARPELIERVLERLSPAEAASTRYKLDHPGPLRLSDVEDARQQLAQLAGRVAMAQRAAAPEPKEALFVA